jgi:hypothetical protein
MNSLPVTVNFEPGLSKHPVGYNKYDLKEITE